MCPLAFEQSGERPNRNVAFSDHLHRDHHLSPGIIYEIIDYAENQAKGVEILFAKLDALEEAARITCDRCEIGMEIYTLGDEIDPGWQAIHKVRDYNGDMVDDLCCAEGIRQMQMRLAGWEV